MDILGKKDQIVTSDQDHQNLNNAISSLFGKNATAKKTIK